MLQSLFGLLQFFFSLMADGNIADGADDFFAIV